MLLALVLSTKADTPKHEVRAVWLTTIGGIDWPHSYSAATQQNELISILDQLQQAGINFYIFQALFWDELFLPGRTQTPEASEFTSRQLGEQLLLEPKDNANAIMALQFFLENKTGLVRQSSVTSPKVPSLRLDWLYTAWNPLDGKDFPAEMQMLLTSSGKAKRLQFKLSNMQVDEKMGNLASPQPGSNYTPMDVNKLLQKL